MAAGGLSPPPAYTWRSVDNSLGSDVRAAYAYFVLPSCSVLHEDSEIRITMLLLPFSQNQLGTSIFKVYFSPIPKASPCM